jgi:hypothetical protein
MPQAHSATTKEAPTLALQIDLVWFPILKKLTPISIFFDRWVDAVALTALKNGEISDVF